MKSILKRHDDSNGGGSNRRRSTLAQPSTVVEIVAEDARLSTVPWSDDGGPRSTSVSPDARHDVDVLRRPAVNRLRHAADELEQDTDSDLRLVDENLQELERQLDSQFQQYDRRLRSPVVQRTQVKSSKRLGNIRGRV